MGNRLSADVVGNAPQIKNASGGAAALITDGASVVPAGYSAYQCCFSKSKASLTPVSYGGGVVFYAFQTTVGGTDATVFDNESQHVPRAETLQMD